jgi:hypothetical protein
LTKDKHNNQSNNDDVVIMDEKYDISENGIAFAIILSSVCIAGLTGLLVFKELENYTAGWGTAGFTLITSLLIFFSSSYFFETGIKNGIKRAKNMTAEQYSRNLSKMIIGVIILFTSLICGYLFKSYSNVFGVMVVLAVSLLSEGHHEEIVSNDEFTAADIFAISLLAIMTLFYLVGIDVLQCEIQTLEVYVVTQSLIIAAGFTANTALFYTRRWLANKLLNRKKKVS